LSTCILGDVLVLNRFRADPTDEAFRRDLEGALAALAGQPGFEDGRIGRNVDEPDLWVLVTRWRHVGSYRRALSSYDVKLRAVPVLSRALDEPSAYEPVEGELNTSVPRSIG
jgi:quinol monooxygenase YgiN